MQDVLNKVLDAKENNQLQQPVLINELSICINDLIVNNFTQLVQLLYRIDIPEKKLKQVLADNASENAGKLIAQMIINRQLQKIELRKKYVQPNIADEDKW
jgi:hypothetical protein